MTRPSVARRERYRDPRVLAAVAATVVLVATYALLAVSPGVGALGADTVAWIELGPLPAFSAGLLGLILGGVALAVWTRRPLLAFGGALFVGAAVLTRSPGGCILIPCTGPERYAAFLEMTWWGPAVSVNHAAGECVRVCPKQVKLLPLLAGVLLVAEAVASVGE